EATGRWWRDRSPCSRRAGRERTVRLGGRDAWHLRTCAVATGVNPAWCRILDPRAPPARETCHPPRSPVPDAPACASRTPGGDAPRRRLREEGPGAADRGEPA